MGIEPAKVHSYAVLNSEEKTHKTTWELANATLALIDPTKSIDSEGIKVSGDQLGSGYGISAPAMWDAVRTMARTEGLLLDPVYTGKAFAGVLAAAKSGDYRSGNRMWHGWTKIHYWSRATGALAR